MGPDLMILRRWAALIRTRDVTAYAIYMEQTGCADFSSTPGNLGSQLMFRDLEDGQSEVTMLSWWRSMEDIRGFAGDRLEVARYYPEDEKFLLTRPRLVEHHRVAAIGSAFKQHRAKATR